MGNKIGCGILDGERDNRGVLALVERIDERTLSRICNVGQGDRV